MSLISMNRLSFSLFPISTMVDDISASKMKNYIDDSFAQPSRQIREV